MSEIIKTAEGSMSEIQLAEENMSEKKMSGKKMDKGKMSRKEMPEDETSETKKEKKKMSWKERAKKKMSWKKIDKKKRSWKTIPKGPKISWKKIAWRPEFKKNLPSFSAIVSAAESAYENVEVKWLFDELKEVMYDRDDLQDEIATERLRRRLENKPQNIKTWLREIISTTLIERRWKEIVARIEYLQIQNKILGLPFLSLDRYSTTYAPTEHTQRYLIPVVKERFEDDFQVVYGRDEDQKAIIKLLLSDDVYADRMDVIPIAGVSGVGKTTLAGLVYKDNRVSKHFDLKGWVYVSDDFDVFRFTKTLLEVFTGQTSDNKDIGDLQVKLKESLYMKKCLLVLDDVCCEDSSVLAMMCEPLLAGAKGSKIVVTTQSASVASKMGTHTAHFLDPLRCKDSWMLFAKHAFDDTNNGSDPELEATGKQIVTKCDGLPLPIVTLGSMLRSDLKIHAWEAVLMKTPDSCTSNFIPVLLISYNSLPEHLKPCFAYCSIFPKGYEYEKEKLVLLWMAAGLLQHVVEGFEYINHSRPQKWLLWKLKPEIEEVGRKYFDYLTSRSFFQQSSANKSRFVMHPAMNDLARLVSGDFCSRLVNNKSQMVSPKVRHLSFSGDLNAERCKAICQETNLVRTLLSYKLPVAETACQLSELEDLFMALRHLRVLSLSHYHITELPDSIKKLKLLRYLDLSHTAITRFPDTVSTLYNLQTLLLSCCHSLAELPKNMGNLVNLRYLDIRETGLEEMPVKMGFLTSLQRLSNFVVGKDRGSKIVELGPLSNLQGTLHISQLQNVVSAEDACEAKLKNKAGLQMLGLEWSDGTVNSQNIRVALEQLEPHKNLKKLSIISYCGKSFPNWLGDSSFNLVFLHLSNCNSCSHLPSLGQLASLKELKVERMNRVKLVGLEFYGINYYRVKPFPSLERLDFQEMFEWKEWISPKIEGEEFPSLKWIRISGCPKLAKDLHLCLPPSAEVEISNSPLLNVPVRDDLQLHDGDKMQFENDDTVAGRPPMHRTEFSSQPMEHRTDVPSTSHSSPPEMSKLLTELAPSKLPVIVEKQLHEGHKSQFRRNEKLPDRPSSSREVESSQLVDTNEVQGTDVSMTEDSCAQHGGASENSPAATDRSSDTDTDDPINVWYDEESLDGISSPEQESWTVSEISQLKRLPPKLYDLKIEGSDALESLPEELMHNNNRYLRRLYIIGCHFLKSIHARSLPNSLKTLYISKCEKLEFLSSEGRISKHTSLEHLCIESSCDSLNSFPLAVFPKLRSLFIQGCANFNSISIGLEDHKYLDALEIRDCAQLKSFPEELRIPNLTSILLSNCKNLKALPGQLHSLTSLQSLFINECPELESFPEGGLPSSLNLFCIRSCHKLTPRIGWGLHQLNNFSRIEIEGGCRDLESFPEQNLLPMKLNSLQISRFPNLKILNNKGLQHLTSLETLKITGCGELQSLSDEGLPSSLSYLYISDCPLLKSKLHNKREEWYKIAHIPHIQIDGKVIS
ncbi:hypothetical protein Ddye_031713 [Dipteronia dyeriana]|uniref:Disease resistance protein n=1 Tax=Dipteronia dyeriana TaxID=168575 RepID=A0AAD9TJH9_9ROSI|nr:hypothetical protein Ddye_031713 [Dipteronia dyeriana]